MNIEITKKEDITSNSLAFLRKYAKLLNVEEDIIISGFLNWHNVDQTFTFEHGEIVHLDLGRLTYSCFKELKKRCILEKGEDYFDEHENEWNIKLPSIDQVDFSDLTNLRLIEYRFHDHPYHDSEVKIEFISFNQFKSLEVLHLTGNLIGEIEINECKKLKILICSKSSLKRLDCSNNFELEFLDCSNNNMTTLNLENNKKLKSLYSLSNPLTKIQFCKEYETNPQINPLETFVLSNAQFELNLTLFPNLKSFTCFSPFQRTLDFSSNKFIKKITIEFNTNVDTIDVSTCDSLNEIYVKNEKKFKTEILCTEKQSFLIPFLAKLNKNKPNSEQKEYLKTLLLHQKALNQEPDNGFYELEKILKDKYCDLATALMIYWTGNPHYFLRFKNIEKNELHGIEFQELEFIKNRILKGLYKINFIPFDPSNFNGTDLTKYTYEDVKPVREIPEALKKAVPGKKMDVFDETKTIRLSIKG